MRKLCSKEEVVFKQEINQDFELKDLFSYQPVLINLKTEWFHQMNNTNPEAK